VTDSAADFGVRKTVLANEAIQSSAADAQDFGRVDHSDYAGGPGQTCSQNDDFMGKQGEVGSIGLLACRMRRLQTSTHPVRAIFPGEEEP
jgi:hypothetical protein